MILDSRLTSTILLRRQTLNALPVLLFVLWHLVSICNEEAQDVFQATALGQGSGSSFFQCIKAAFKSWWNFVCSGQLRSASGKKITVCCLREPPLERLLYGNHAMFSYCC
jgi:hypothetical protein